MALEYSPHMLNGNCIKRIRNYILDEKSFDDLWREGVDPDCAKARDYIAALRNSLPIDLELAIRHTVQLFKPEAIEMFLRYKRVPWVQRNPVYIRKADPLPRGRKPSTLDKDEMSAACLDLLSQNKKSYFYPEYTTPEILLASEEMDPNEFLEKYVTADRRQIIRHRVRKKMKQDGPTARSAKQLRIQKLHETARDWPNRVLKDPANLQLFLETYLLGDLLPLLSAEGRRFYEQLLHPDEF